jgi:flavorubredoxin
MPQRSKIITLPEETLAELNKKLVAGKFSDYAALAEWLQQQGFDISRSSLHRYGQDFAERLAAISMATEQARAVAEAASDDGNAMNEALIRLVQTKAFDALIATESAESLPKMGVMIAKLSKASVDQKKWAAETRKKAAAAVKNIEEKTATVGKKSLDPETLRIIREEIYGIVPASSPAN